MNRRFQGNLKGGTGTSSGSVTFTPAGNIASTNVQAAIEELDTKKLANASNLSDVANPATAFGNIKQAATDAVSGVILISTNAKTITGTDTDSAITPANLTAKIDTDTTLSGNLDTRIPSQKAVKSYVDTAVSGATGVPDGSVAGDMLIWTGTAYSAVNLYSLVSGMTWNESTDVYTRTGALAGFPLGVTPGDYWLPIHKLMKRCVVSDAGVIQYYLSPTDSTKKADGSAAVLDGTDGQVMVYIPAFYYRYAYLNNLHSWEISPVQLDGFSLHPAFQNDGVTKSYRLYGAYEGYKNGSNILCSITGVSPTVSVTRANFRTYAAARGDGWRQQEAYLDAAVHMLYAVEYADFDTQAIIGAGNTAYASWPGAPPSVTGLSNNQGNRTASATTAGGAATNYMSYRGIENWYGHIGKFVDGMNIHNSTANRSRLYLCNNRASFADDTDSGYTLIGLLAETDGYFKTLVQTGVGFYPAGVGGGSATYLADYYYTYFDNNPDIGWRVALRGGSAAGGALAGAFFWSFHDGAAYASSYFGGRLCF